MPQIEHVALYADGDPTALKDFYVEAFGFHVLVDNHQASPPGYFLSGTGGGMALEIIGRPPEASNSDQRYICHVAILVDDVAATRATLEARGLSFEPDTAVANDSMTTCFFRDPAGNRVQIVHRPHPLGS